MTKKEKATLTHLLQLGAKRVIPSHTQATNHEEFWKWQGNACRQTAFWVAFYLDKCYPGRKIDLYEGLFVDEVLGNHEHAYTYMWPDGDEPGLLVDVSRITYPTIVDFRNELPEDLSEYFQPHVDWDVHHIKSVQVDWKKMLEAPEFYTGDTYEKFCQKITDVTEAWGKNR